MSDALIEECCEVMHDAYERAAVGAGWETNPASRKPWADVPEANKATMRAAVSALLAHLGQLDEGVKPEDVNECSATTQWGSTGAMAGHKHRCAIPLDEHTVKIGLRQHSCQCGSSWKTREA